MRLFLRNYQRVFVFPDFLPVCLRSRRLIITRHRNPNQKTWVRRCLRSVSEDMT